MSVIDGLGEVGEGGTLEEEKLKPEMQSGSFILYFLTPSKIISKNMIIT